MKSQLQIFYKFNLEKEGYEVYCAYDGDEALKMVEEDTA